MTERDASEKVALEQITEALKIAHDIPKMVRVGEDDKETQAKGLIALGEISGKLKEFQDKWMISKINGTFSTQPHAAITEALDVKLFASKKLDFKHMKKMMYRILSGYSAITGIALVENNVEWYKSFCETKGLKDGLEKAQLFQRFLAFQTRIVETEINELKTQIENVNFYYQNFMVSKAVKVAYVSLAVSSLAFFLTILQALHII